MRGIEIDFALRTYDMKKLKREHLHTSIIAFCVLWLPPISLFFAWVFNSKFTTFKVVILYFIIQNLIFYITVLRYKVHLAKAKLDIAMQIEKLKKEND